MDLKHLSPVRRRFLEFMVAVTLVHVLAIALYVGLKLSQAAPSTQRYFAWGWTAVTVMVVIAGLQRLKRARRR